ncbi:centrosome-associated protein 350-like, partial [Chiloscyllium plagiosum]|uniref:centrosome-associated protein 350-like n=1 Tax=Chiloscyllium plagiosum TaxID=36176 RepID=UPI001CB816BF
MGLVGLEHGNTLYTISSQAEIRHFQEANKAAHRARQLILKQQEEIQHMLQTTIKIQERLKSAGESKLVPTRQEQRDAEQPGVENVSKVSPTSSPLQTDMETWSPSCVSTSGSETSSIMQKLKKMRSHMDEKSHHWASLVSVFPTYIPNSSCTSATSWS